MGSDVGPVASIFAELGLDSTPFVAALDQSEKSLDHFAKYLNSVISIIPNSMTPAELAGRTFSDALEQLSQKGIKSADSLKDIAEALGLVSKQQIEAIAYQKEYNNELERMTYQRQVFARSMSMGLGIPDNLRDDKGRFRKRDIEELQEYNNSLNSIESDRIESERFYAEEELEIFQMRVAERAEAAATLKALDIESTQATIEMADKIAAASKQEIASRQDYYNLVNQLRKESYQAAEYETQIELEQSAKRQEALRIEAASRQDYVNLITRLAEEEARANTISGPGSRIFSRIGSSGGYMGGGSAPSSLDSLLAGGASSGPGSPITGDSGGGLGGLGGSGGGGAGGSSGGIGLRMGANGVYPYLRLGQSLSGVASMLAPVMDIIFPAALIGLAADMVVDYGKKVLTIVDDLNGLGEAQKKVWDDAFKGENAARQELLRYKEQVNEVKVAGLKKSGKDITDFKARGMDLEEARKLQKALITEIGVMEKVPHQEAQQGVLDYAASPLNALITVVRNLQGAPTPNEQFEKIKDDREALKKIDAEISKLQIDQAKDMNKLLHETDGHLKKMHDTVHEYSERLPSSHTINPAAYMLQTLGFGPQPIQMVKGGSYTNPPAGRVSTPRSYPNTAGSSGVQSSGGSHLMTSVDGGISFSFHFDYKFDGIPADVNDFMRNKAEPKLIDDIKLNTRGVADQIIQALKAKGVRIG